MGVQIFNTTPTWVHPMEDDFNVITTVSENLKKEYFLPEDTSNIQYKLIFEGVKDTTFISILQSYRDVSGTFDSFYWDSVPTYIDGGAGSGVSMLGRWISKKFTPQAKSHWEVELVFEKE